jgi:hypothetical protein
VHSIYFLVLAFILALTTTAAAQDIEGRAQLGLTTPIIAYTSQTVTNDDNDVDADVTQTSWGIRENVTLELGYGLSELIVLGAIATIGGTSQTYEVDGVDDEQESSELSVSIGPKLDLVFSPGSDVRPFVGAVVGLAMTSTESPGGTETSMAGPQLLGRLGLHWFAKDSFSLSPSLAFGYSSMSGEVESDDGSQSVDVSGSAFSISLLIGVAGWI